MAVRRKFIKELAYFENVAEMQYKLGAFYYHGMEGLNEDHEKAQAWFTAAAENGHGDAALHLGYMHYKGYGTNTSKEASHKWLAASAKKNNTEAAYRLGYLYYTGEGVGRNYQLAARQFRSAAERQHAGAAAMLGYMYHKGRGLPMHNKLAILWFRRAAELGDSSAMINLGVMNFRGKGTRKDFVLAYMWFGLAHQLGDQETSYNGLDYMNRLVAKGKISSEEIVEAVDLGQEWAEKHGLTDQQHGGYQANPPTTVRKCLLPQAQQKSPPVLRSFLLHRISFEECSVHVQLPPGTRVRSRSGKRGGSGNAGDGGGVILELDPEGDDAADGA